MHRAWYIDDIRHLVFERLKPQDLARLARTCKALFDVATDELWKTVHSFSPLLCCLPPAFRRRPFQAEDIQRLDLYASKVQHLLLESDRIEDVIRLPPQFKTGKKRSPKHLKKSNPEDSFPEGSNPGKSWEELWEDIGKLRPVSEFLPNLRRLRINNVVEDLLIPLVGISGSNLTHIYIKYIQNRQPESIVLKLLDSFHETPKLEYLFVRDGEPDLVPSKLIQQAPLKQLRLDPRIHAGRHEDFQFKAAPLRPEILRISTLEHLTIGLTQEWYSPEIDALKESKYLPALKTLWLNLTTFKPVTSYDGLRRVVEGTDSWKRSPSVFLEGLDNPELSLLNIKFSFEATGSMFLDVVSAANGNCRLQNLNELALAGGGWFNNCDECGAHPGPNIKPPELRQAMKVLLPLPQLKVLRLSVAPNFLDVLDLELYKSFTDGLPALEKLWLGHREFIASSQFEGTKYYERVPLHHLAAFCSMLPSLVEVSVGTGDGLTLEEQPRAEWACPSVKSLVIPFWAGDDRRRGVSRDLLHQGLRTYFPNSDLAEKGYNPRLYFFED